MRRKDREITEYGKILEVMEKCDCCRLGFVDEGSAYIVPLNFGFLEQDGKITLYFHGAHEGRKMDLLKKQEVLGFEMDAAHRLKESETACGYSYFYQSIIGKGRVLLVLDEAEKEMAIRQIMRHYSGRSDWELGEEAAARAAVWKLEVLEWSGKEHV